MRTFVPVIFCLFLPILIYSCKEKVSTQPCNGNGIITFNNKTDSSVLIQVVEAHNTFTLNQNYIKSVTVKGNQSYKLLLEGRNYYKDTSLSVNYCETKSFIISR